MEDYLSILNSIQDNTVRDRNDDILIIDGQNMLIRAFSCITAINSKGHNVGGITGFLKTLGSLKRQFNPTRVIVAWDGRGGAQSRKNINSNYKAQRALAPVVHWDIYDSKEEENQSLYSQADRIEDYLSYLPVTYVKIDKLEADDIIARMALIAASQDKHVTIASSDKDFLQLVSSNIDVYSPTKKILYNYQETFNYLGVLPENYNIVKSLVGDNSDNLRGVKGLGIRTVIKLFPDLVTNPDCNLQYIYDTCAANLGTKKIYATILNDWQTVENNFKVMDLHNTVLSEFEQKILYKELHRSTPNLQIGKFLLLLEQDYITGLTSDDESWLTCFSNLN